ncbi:MAG: helix-turn-helix transcriptional regulator, partial [Candidatus Hydrogenedentes bacterium]|nr:helix-turn-helix transcriptional regulator [Candidatus Hydrogenedentota bacterium]
PDRAAAATDALRRNEPTPFICHMGFACLAAPLLEPEFGLAITLGPYCPSEGAEALEPDARSGLRALDAHDRAQLPFLLRDIPVTSATVLPTILLWLREVLRAMWDAAPADEDAEDAEPERTEAVAGRARRRIRKGLVDAYQAGPISAALSGAVQGKARELVAGVLSGGHAPARRRLAAQRARAVALAAAVLETSEQAGLACEPCWERFAGFVEAARAAGSAVGLADAVMDLLGTLKRATARTAPKAPEYAELNRLVLGRLEEGITLNEVAAAIGVHPTAITHRLQRNFDMSFSEYLGRLRVDKAKELLRRTKLPVVGVAQRIGVRDVSNFGKLFRKFEQMSPLEYRKQFEDGQ